ncbi:MAG TPA: hypothetical protein DCS13_12945 [Candidatus Margulisbacteria bacterium]|nr:MAG: DNA-formamidopyrimidine glycosylase [Candidatus Margulisbacteria bacterium GWD2_39_127]OGI03622.1 MAG: DNA-formamidopyrimidine glycosylase [Candidatus Margulisbacteria bacterium GWF2_38_17]HAR64365.1 hypothetical protein [Candidatus Margulisiibacteriota bacterium]
MPELPEVETITNDLASLIKGDTFLKVTVADPFVLRDISDSDFVRLLTNKTIVNVKRLGKMIDIVLSDNYHLLVHLKMTGKFYFFIDKDNKAGNEAALDQLTRHTHIVFIMKNSGILAYSDVRKFSVVYVKKDDQLNTIPYIAELGVDPLGKDYSFSKFTQLLAKAKKRNIKSFLLDQHFIAGIGNIYASEILFETGVSPLRTINTLSSKNIEDLFCMIPDVLARAVKASGTTFSDYRDVSGDKGSFQSKLNVYGRQAQKCLKCGREIIIVRQNNRSTFYCGFCQK